MKAHNTKLWILAYISFRFFLGGVEEFIIIPTLWRYVNSLGGSVAFLGAVAAAYGIGVASFSPLFGRLARKYRHVYVIMVMSGWVKLCASILYSIPVSKLCPLFGRFISGIADSCDGMIYDEVARYTDNVDRMKYALVFDGIFTLGTAFGAIACSSVTIHENVFGWSIGVGNTPGIMLAAIWLVFFSLTFYLPCTFGVDITSMDQVSSVSSSSEQIDEISMVEADIPEEDDEGSTAKADIAEQDDESSTDKADIGEDRSKDGEQGQQLASTSCKIFIDSRIACLLYLTFLTMFLSSVASFFPSLLALKLFKLKVIHVKLLFVNGTLALILLFLVLYLAARRFQERSLLAFILSIQFPPLVILVFLATAWKDVTLYHSCYLLLIYICLGLPYFGFTICGSLLSKFTKEREYASTYQPLFMVLVQIAIISSRLIAGFVFGKPALLFFSAGLILMWLVGVIWFCLVFRRLSSPHGRYF